ncbi:MAG: MFS transporter [Elusimicrobiota bacterium]|nr:MFS transporter [Elusimicrobiota bacterium]
MDKDIFKSLQHKNFRLFFIGQAVSMTGSWMQITALPWLVYRLTNSEVLLGLVGFLSQIFVLVFSAISGAVADHYNKRKLLILTQTLLMLQAIILAALTISGKIQIFHIIILVTFIGVVFALDMPARQAFLIEMVGKEDLMNAIALNSAIVNGSRLIGPAIAGILIATVGEGYCFLLNGISFIYVIVVLFMMTNVSINPVDKAVSVTKKFFAGFEYVRSSKTISSILFLCAMTGLISAFPMVLMPVFVKDVFHLDASGLGIFMSAIGVGAILGTVKVATRKSTEGLERLIVNSAIGFGLGVVAFSLSKNIFFAVSFLILSGYFMILQMASSNTLIQLITSDDMRGRVMGFFTMAFMGFAPIGSLASGFLAHKISAPMTVVIGGFLSVVITIIVGKKIFVKKS